MADIQSLRRRVTMSIASATSISTALDCEGYRVASIDWASGTTANAPLTFSVSQDGTSFFDLYDDAGAEVSIASGSFSTAAARSIAIGPTLAIQLGAHRYVKFRRGTAASPSSAGATAYPFDVVLTPW